jgi:serine phosphatase RsbU (regulator of sigma subunit)
MSTTEIRSEALQLAAQQSERTRAVGMIVVLVVLLAVGVIRAMLSGAAAELRLLPIAVATVGGMIAYEAAMLILIGRAIRSKRLIPPRGWLANLFVEMLFPSGLLLLLTETPALGPYRALAAPAVLIYLLLIILSTLRLSPWLSGLTGVFASGGYLAITAYTYWRYGAPDVTSGAFPMAVYATFAFLLLVGGWVAAAVAGQIRGHVVAALREARQVERMEHDLGLARSIQQGLLPKEPPRIDGFDIAGWNKPAEQTGGDYFDWFRLQDGRTVLSLGDVTGHGIGPALVTAVCRAYGRACLPSEGDLGKAMDSMDALLLADLPTGKLITFVAAVLDPTSASLQLLSAGHGPLLVYRAADDRVDTFKAHGVPFGIGMGVGYGPAQTVTLAPGDMLVLITDGFFEWENAREEQFGLERLEATVRAARHLPASDIISRLHEKVTDFAGGTEQADDLTAVIVKRDVTAKPA